MSFALKLAFQSIIKEKWINLLSTFSIGIGFFILFSIIIIVYNVERLSKMLPERFSAVIYIKDSASKIDVEKIEKRLRSDSLVKKVKFISKDSALEELKSKLKESDYIFKALDVNPLFDSFEIRLEHEQFHIDTIKNFLKEIKELKAVDDVEYGENVLESIYFMNSSLRILGISIVLTFGISIIFICYCTVKILFFRHKEELEIYKLLGASRGFIRAQFLLEGSLIGLTGGVLGALMLFLSYNFLLEKLISTIPIFSFLHIPVQLVYALPLFGCLFGLPAALFAIGKIKY